MNFKMRSNYESDGSETSGLYFFRNQDKYGTVNFMLIGFSSNAEKGFEVLNNIQIFFPGDRFYNQFQEFDA